MRHAVDAAPRLLSANPPLVVLREWMAVMAEYAMTKQGLADALGIQVHSTAAPTQRA